MGQDIYTEVVQRCAAILGGHETLAAHLNVPAIRVEYWMDGALTPPADVFLRLVDLVMAEEREGQKRRARQPLHPSA